MYHVCLRIVVNTADAEDILQEAFLEAFTTLNLLKNTSAFAGWLKRIVINKSLNFVNRKKESWVDIDITDTSVLQEEQFDEQEFHNKTEAVKQAIDNLPVKYRVVLNLHIFEKLGFEEIAILLQMPAATARSQYLRAKQKTLAMLNIKKDGK